MRLSRKLKMIDISGKMAGLLEYFRGHRDIIAVYLYGSYDTQFQTPLSDVDLGLLTREKTGLKEELKLWVEITGILEEEDVNIVYLNGADLVMQYKILSTGRLIYCGNRLLLADFREKVCKLYGDFSIDLKNFYAEYDQALKEAYLNG